MKEYTYLIYQIKDIVNTLYAFRSWDEAKELIKLSDYDGVYTAKIESKEEKCKEGDEKYNVLEELFLIFNLNHPDDFRGHSLSVSDIIALIDDKGTTWWYCDSFGWQNITDYMKETGRNKL